MPRVVNRITPCLPSHRKICDKTYCSVTLECATETHNKTLAWVFAAAEELPITLFVVAHQQHRMPFVRNPVVRERRRVAWRGEGPLARLELVDVSLRAVHEV